MHTKPMAEHEGDFGKEKKSDRACPSCKQTVTVTYKVWESSCGGHEDYKYTCTCGHTWWIDGIDS